MLIKTEVVIGEVTTQVFIVSDIMTFGTPVYKVIDEITEVAVDDCFVCTDKVVFNGTLTKNLIFKEQPDPQTGEGRVLFHETRLPFTGFVEVPGAEPGDTCQVESARVGDCNFLLPLTRDAWGNVLTAQEKTIVEITLKVTRTEQIEVGS